MNIDIRYGKDGAQKINLPEENPIGVFYPKEVECGPTGAAIMILGRHSAERMVSEIRMGRKDIDLGSETHAYGE